MRIGLEIEPILERAGLALVAVDRHQPRARLAEHRAPFARGRKARAAEPAQARPVERLEERLGRKRAGRDAARAACSRPSRHSRRSRCNRE